MKTFKHTHGFTMAELLVVVAVLGILAAIAIPVFQTQLQNSRKSIDEANARTAVSLAVSEYHSSDRTGPAYDVYHLDGKMLDITLVSTTHRPTRTPAGFNQYVPPENPGARTQKGIAGLLVTVEGGVSKSVEWVEADRPSI